MYSVNFSHGNIIGNYITNGVTLGNMNWHVHWSNGNTYERYKTFHESGTNVLSTTSEASQSAIFNDIIPFGNINTYSDTVNIIANDFNNNIIGILTLDFPFHIFNNYDVRQVNLIRHAPSSKGRNRIINNEMSDGVRWWIAHNNGEDNLDYINIDFLNNSASYNSAGSSYSFYFDTPTYSRNNSSTLGPILEPGLIAYNSGSNSYYIFEGNSFSTYNQYNGTSNWDQANYTPFLMLGPGGTQNGQTLQNPSPEFLNLDLTLNSRGKDGGSHAWDNYHPTGAAGFGTIGNNKARITYLNLPTQIFDPSNITIKAKAVHGN